MMSNPPRKGGPYQSALDLPSVAEMLELIRGAKALTRVIARDQRSKVLQVEAELKHLSRLIDGFYALLGDRNWIFHDRLNTDRIAALVGLTADEGERKLIDLYQDHETLEFLVGQLYRFPQLRDRRHLIERAQHDYREGRYYSVVLVLLAVMDGFVNDLDTQSRRGLHTRTAEEMAAWDSVVGHHLGLSNAHKTFGKGFYKASNEEVHELYRNGIMHGMLTNFDNDIVATKAWNRLFAVTDWATSLERQAVPPDPEPTWPELFRKIRENEEAKKALAEWQPRVVTEQESGFTHDPLYTLATDYLTAWLKKNYGRMAQLLSPLVREETERKTAGMVRENCQGFELTGFVVRRLDYEAPAVCEIDVELHLGNETKAARLRWIRTGEDGMAVTPNQPGEWRLISWGPWAMINNAKRHTD
jgi:hypothetical protein